MSSHQLQVTLSVQISLHLHSYLSVSIQSHLYCSPFDQSECLMPFTLISFPKPWPLPPSEWWTTFSGILWVHRRWYHHFHLRRVLRIPLIWSYHRGYSSCPSLRRCCWWSCGSLLSLASHFHPRRWSWTPHCTRGWRSPRPPEWLSRPRRSALFLLNSRSPTPFKNRYYFYFLL